MKNCSFLGCEEEDSLPFKCKLCSQTFCAKHRLPEQHNCPRIGIYQTEEYIKTKLSPKKVVEDKKEGKKRKDKSKKQKGLYTARDLEMKSKYVEPQDRFLLRSQMFTLYTFKYNFLNILLGSLYFLVIVSLSLLFDLTVIEKLPIQDWPTVLLLFMIGFFISISVIYGGHLILESLYAKRLGIRATHSLWIQGLFLGIVSIFIPIIMTPNFLLFSEYGSSSKDRGKVALSGVLWILGWQFLTVIFSILSITGIFSFSNYFYFGFQTFVIFFFIYLIFSMIPFGFNRGRYIRSWNNKLFWYLIGTT
ncbi:MAG: AN1-type zinc finger domain-containing protein, partial [Candidatus Heimdallarchaeota archaeon]|nr:AN1-type zinc finger domain-containing protein [Candidatus Heimdallarchaeota archaeon]